MLPLLFALVACDTSTKSGDTSGSDDTAGSTGPGVVLAAGDLDYTSDATPSPDGGTIYFLTDEEDNSALFEITDDGINELAGFRDARGLVVNPDGSTIYVADNLINGLFAVPAAGGEPASISNTQGFSPTAIEMSDGDLYFTGSDPVDGGGAVYRVALDGGVPQLVAGDFPVALEGVVVRADGAVYVAGGGVVFAIVDGVVTPLAEGLTLGSPAGLALTPDDASLMVSSLSADGKSQVVLIDLTALTTSIFDDVISANVGSGGLHRAQEDASIYAWCGITSGGSSGVYRIGF